MTRRVGSAVATGAPLLLLLSFAGHGAGASTLESCGGLEATIVGTAGDDSLFGTDEDDVIAGLDGNDYIYGGKGADVLCGGDGGYTSLHGDGGADILIVETSGTVDGGTGNDTIDAAAAPPGTVTLSFDDASGRIVVNLQKGIAKGLGKDTVLGVSDVYGTEFDDKMIGDETVNNFYAQSGNDTLAGREGDDLLSGAAGVDDLTGGVGHDYLYGGGGSDSYSAGKGKDYLSESSSDTGDDSLFGGPGADRLYGGFGVDYGDGGPSDDDYCNVDIESQVNCESS